jgi:hypothetical protein
MQIIHRLFAPEYVTDEDGRPIAEHRAAAALQSRVPMDLKICPYAGSRFKHERPMNTSALNQMLKHWDKILEALAYCHSLCGGEGG